MKVADVWRCEHCQAEERVELPAHAHELAGPILSPPGWVRLAITTWEQQHRWPRERTLCAALCRRCAEGCSITIGGAPLVLHVPPEACDCGDGSDGA